MEFSWFCVGLGPGAFRGSVPLQPRRISIMRAVAYQTPRPIDAVDALVDVELPRPVPAGRDLLVAVRAVSVNPVDTKVRRSVQPGPGDWKVLGWDAAGV